MNIILFDTPEQRKNLLPLTYTRPIAEFRCGIYTLSEKWSERGQKTSFLTEEYLSDKYPANSSDDNFYINGATLYTSDIWDKIKSLSDGEGNEYEGEIIALRTFEKLNYNFDFSKFKNQQSTIKINFINNV